MARQSLFSLRAKSDAIATKTSAMFDEKIARDGHDIEPPLTQRRNGHRKYIEPVIKILAKDTLGNSLGHIAV
jgi:hypothetical protein